MKKALVLVLSAFLVAAVWFGRAGFAPANRGAKKDANSENVGASPPTPTLVTPTVADRRVAQSSDNSTVATLPSSKERQDFLAKYPGDWKFHEADKGEIRSLMGGTFPKVSENDESALAFLREIAPMLGTQPENLRPSMIQPSMSARGRSFRVDQVVDGILVYQAQATLVGNKQTGDGFIVNSTIRSVQHDGSKAVLNALQAEEKILARYNLEAGDAGLINPDPVLFEIKSGHAVLAWVFSADLKGNPSGSHEVVVSAMTGEILYVEARFAN